MENVAEKQTKHKGRLTAVFTVRRWLRTQSLNIPCTAPQAAVLLTLATFGNPDGSSIRPGVDDLVAITRLDRTTVMDALYVWRHPLVGAITRTRGGNRAAKQADEYQLNLDWQGPRVSLIDLDLEDSKVAQADLCKSRLEQLMDSHKSPDESHKSPEQGHKSPGATPPKFLSTETSSTETTKGNPLNPPFAKTAKGDSHNEQLFHWKRDVIAISFGRRKRLPKLDRFASYSAQEICDLLTTRGFPSRIVTETTVLPDHIARLNPETRMRIARLDPDTRTERNMRNLGLDPSTFRWN